ncbi:hypothetical protein Bca4012_004839 [Brassica carinata]
MSRRTARHRVEKLLTRRLSKVIACPLGTLHCSRSGSDIRGYFQWSFMDMFEFINPNYTYGLYYVNFSDPKRERSPKTSALWYSALLKGKTVSLQKLKNRSMSSSPGVSCQ